MAYNEFLADRVRQALRERSVSFEEKNMMGGLTFMVNEKMCAGVLKDELMLRLDPAIHEEAVKNPGCREMDFTGRPMKGFVFLDAEAWEPAEGLDHWLGLALEYNPRARSSKKRK